MKKHWLRGLLLGVSMALLLAGGVALAAPSISIDPYCGVCCEGEIPNFGAAKSLIECEDFWTITTGGWGASETLDVTINLPGSEPPVVIGSVSDADGDWVALLHLMCWSGEDLIDTFAVGPHVWISLWRDWAPDDYGKWNVRVEGASGAVEADFYFAEDISVCRAMEFVPEPGSILLLGTGLAGLAGYATLRWRARG